MRRPMFKTDEELEFDCDLQYEYPVSYFMGREFSPYSSIIEHNTFLDPKFLAEVSAYTDIFDETSLNIMSDYIRRNYSDYSVIDKYYAMFDRKVEYEKKYVTVVEYDNCELRPAGQNDKVIIDIKPITYSWNGISITTIDRSITVDKREGLNSYVIMGDQNGQIIIVKTAYIDLQRKGDWVALLDYEFNVQDDLPASIGTSYYSGDDYDFFNVYVGEKIIKTEHPNIEYTLNNLRKVAVDMTALHHHEWDALKQIADRYYEKVRDGSIANNYDVKETNSGNDTETETRNFTDTNTPNLTQTVTPRVKTRDTEVNSRVSNIVEDGFHDQDKTVIESESYDGENTTTNTGTDTTTKTGSGTIQKDYGRNTNKSGYWLKDQVKLYDTLWKTTHMEWIKKVADEMVFPMLYMSYGF